MDDKKSYLVLNLNKNAVLAKIPKIEFKDARRMQGPIYDVLIKELNEQGCKEAAKHFQCLANKEDYLFSHRSIRDRIQDDSELLYEIFDYCIEAEKAYNSNDCNGLSQAFHYIYELVMLIEQQDITFHWIVPDVYEIVMKIIRHIDPNRTKPEEFIARLYYAYGLHLSHSNEGTEKSVKYLRKALELCRGQKWSFLYQKDMEKDAEGNDIKGIKTLHEETAHTLAEVIVKYSKMFAKDCNDVATEMAKEAMSLVAEVGISSNKYEFYNAFITYAEYLVDSSKHTDAMKLINKFDTFFNQEDKKRFSRLYCKQLLLLGVCHESLNNIEQAKMENQKAITIARENSYRDLEAHALVQMGMLFALKKVEYSKGKAHYGQARKIFFELGDRENETKTHYLLAKLRADEMFPFFYDVLKLTNSEPCNVYKLRRWKNVCDPFWIGWSRYLAKVTVDPLTCLLESETADKGFQAADLTYIKTRQGSVSEKHTGTREKRQSDSRKKRHRSSTKILGKFSTASINALKVSTSRAILSEF